MGGSESANTKEKGRKRGWEGGWCTKTRHCVAQLAARDEEEKYPEGEIQGWRTRRRRRVVTNETERKRKRERERTRLKVRSALEGNKKISGTGASSLYARPLIIYSAGSSVFRAELFIPEVEPR